MLFTWRYYGAQVFVAGDLLYDFGHLEGFRSLDEYAHLVVVPQPPCGQVGGPYDHLIPVNHYYFGVQKTPVRLFKFCQFEISSPKLIVQILEAVLGTGILFG